MSYDVTVFLKESAVPVVADIKEKVSLSGLRLTLDDSRSLADLRGYLPVNWKGVDAGFEVFIRRIDEAEVSDYQEDLVASGGSVDDDDYYAVLTSNDLSMTFSCKNEDEIEAATAMADILRSVGGVSMDPQLGTLIGSDGRELRT